MSPPPPPPPLHPELKSLLLEVGAMAHCPEALRESIAHYLATLDDRALSYAGMLRYGLDVESVYSPFSPWRSFAARLYADAPGTSELGRGVSTFSKSRCKYLKALIPDEPGALENQTNPNIT